MNKPTLYIPVGIPGSGKSTWAQERKLKIVSTDKIRRELYKSLVVANSDEKRREANAKVFPIFHERIMDALKNGEDVVADATNVTSKARRELRRIAFLADAKTTVVIFDVAPAVHWNRQRDIDAVVPDDVMDRMTRDYLAAMELIPGESYNLVRPAR